MSIEVKPVRTKKEKHILLTMPWKIYKDDPLWVPPIFSDRKKLIDPKQGAFFQRGIVEFFIAWKDGEPVGTICAARDDKAIQNTGKKMCVWGFFECIEDYDVACALWGKAIEWGRERGLEFLYGPFDLDYEDSYGIMTEGWDRPPVMLCGHTPRYYLDFVQRYGFKPGRGENLAYMLELEETPALIEVTTIADRVRRKDRFRIFTPDFNDWEGELDRLLPLLNKALAHLEWHIPWQREQLGGLLEPFKMIADPELVLFAEYKDKMIGFFPAVPDMNEVLIHANGLRYPWNYLQALWYDRKPKKTATVKSLLVDPDYWGSGVAVLLFDEMMKRLRRKGFERVDLSITSDDNPKTPQLAERVGGKIYKRYQIYSYPIE